MRNIWPHPAKERIETAMRVELSVHALYCLADKNNPTHIRVFEMHANIDAYKAHLESALQKIQSPDSGDGQVPQSRAGESDYSCRQPDTYMLAVGAFADPSFPQPSVSIFEESKHTWMQLPDGMKHFQGNASWQQRWSAAN